MAFIGQMANVPCLASCIFHFCDFYQMVNLPECLNNLFFGSMQAWYKIFESGTLPCEIFIFPRMQCTILVLQERLSKVTQRN